MNGIQKVVGSIPIVSTRLSLDAIRVPGSFFIEMSGSRFSQSKLTFLPTRLSLDAVRVPGSFFIEMSSSRFSQSKRTTLSSGVFPEQKPHKKIRPASCLTGRIPLYDYFKNTSMTGTSEFGLTCGR